MTMTLSGDGTITGLVAGGLPNATVTADDLASGAAVSNIGYTPANQQAENINFRNRIINGDMRIDQRNAGASVSMTAGINGVYTLDRWRAFNSTDGAFTVQQVTTAPTGFTNSLQVTVTTADASVTTNQQAKIQQRIEGFNVSDLDFGTANAKTITLSFWVRSSVTGTYAVGFINGGQNRSYVATYTIDSVDTWEQKSITITGDTTGTWLTNNSIGLNIQWSLGIGPDLQTTAGSWQASEYSATSTSVELIGTLNATWYVTGVQLEVGSVATPFERRPYGTELALCQRYYYKIKADAGGQVLGSGMMNSATTGRFFIPFIVPMRTSPSALEQSGTASNYVVFNGGSAQNCSAVPTFNSATLFGAGLEGTIASGGTTGYGALIRADSSAAFLAWSAEL